MQGLGFRLVIRVLRVQAVKGFLLVIRFASSGPESSRIRCGVVPCTISRVSIVVPFFG